VPYTNVDILLEKGAKIFQKNLAAAEFYEKMG
jgi:hypothetical protein